MPVRVLFFGATADITGAREVNADVAGTTASEFLEHITTEHPQLASRKLLIAINQQYAKSDSTITDGDEVAIFTPVSGG